MTSPDDTRTCCGPAAGGITRRSVLTGALAMGALAGIGGLPGLGRTGLAFAGTPYAGDTLVVLSLNGGFDGLSAVVPAFDPGYAAARPTIGIPTSALLQLDGRFGMHPALAPLAPLWSAGQLAFVQAVGQSDPTRSHFQAMEELERAAPGTSLRTGWLDRTIGVAGPGSPFAATQLGQVMADQSFIGPNPVLTMNSIADFTLDWAWDDTERLRWASTLTALQADAPPLVRGAAGTALSALGTAAGLAATPYAPAGGAVYPDGELGPALRDVAQLIKAGVGLQVAAVDMGNWDMHVDMGMFDDPYGWMRMQLDELARSLAAFATDLGPAFGNVTVVTLSEFGRRVGENGSGGVDHGHGNAVMLLGGGVNGGSVYGQWPGLDDPSLVDGDLAGTTDYRTVLAEILERRCGLSAGAVFPGLPGSRLGALKQR